jgi:hypothetical protein
MKKIIIFTAFIAISFSLGAVFKNRADQSGTKSGKYVPSDLITKSKLKDMPVPHALEDYALFQSIGKVTNVVIGDFKSGENKITLITDNNADGVVDAVSTWDYEQKKFSEIPKPSEHISKEKFLQMKKDIFAGASDSGLRSNPEGIHFLKKVMEERATRMVKVSKHNRGYRIAVTDADDTRKNRLVFSYSDNGILGKDAAFEVHYRIVGEYNLIPVIKTGVFCKNSVDPYVIEVIEEIKKIISDNYKE